ncbi:MAG: hypothetical protein HOJ97_03030 [Alphaproteobacteria bacterium]|nr:hypothetical protein [Alphaproteobacteria bacterium]
MFTLSKLLWLGIILFIVWNLFRIIEKRHALNEKNKDKSEKSKMKTDSQSEPLPAIYCPTCATFVAGNKCEREDCGISNQSNG